MSTFAEIVTRIVTSTGRSDRSTDIGLIVNEEMQAIQRHGNFYFMEEVVGRMVTVDVGKMALPTDFKDWGDITLLTHDGTILPGGLIEVLSASASDTTQTATVVGLDLVGDLVTETKTLTGQTAVAFTGHWTQIESVTLSAACAGIVTVRKASAGATLATIAIASLTATGTLSISSTPIEGPLTTDDLSARYSPVDTGAPSAFSDDRGELRLFPPRPDEADTWSLRLRYYKFLADLSGSQTNELTNRWPDLVESKATAKFYANLPGSVKEEERWQKRAEDPRTGMPGLIRLSNLRRLKDKTGLTIRSGVRYRTTGLGSRWVGR